MINRKITYLLAFIMISSTLSGCSSVFWSDATKYPLEPQLSDQEVVDYYKEALSYNTIATRNLTVQETKYETKEVTGDKAERLKSLVGDVESALSEMTYTYSIELDKTLKQTTFNYIKAYLNDGKLDNGSIESISEALGYYFVDVKYELTPRTVGNLLPQATLLGLHGSFTQDYLGYDSVNDNYIKKSVINLNQYYNEKEIDNSVVYNEATKGLTMSNNKLYKLDFTTDVGEQVDNSYRLAQVNTSEFNKMAGSSISQSAYMPELNQVYTVPSAEGTIGGIGIYPQGIGGLAKFGFNRDNMKGTVKLRYVFKNNDINPSEILGVNVYPVESQIDSGFSVESGNIVVPDFLMTELQKVIDRADRATVNVDLPALMSGNIFSDMGIGVLTGYESKYTRVLRNMSDIRRIVARDTKNDSYLVEVETARQEGPKDLGSFGTYKDTSYITIQQLGTEFIITDTVRMARQMTKEPSINPESSVNKRLIALNLAGEVSEDNKSDIQQLLSNWYMAGTARVLHGPQEAKVNGNKTNVEMGMYDCFNSDVAMLSTDNKEYLNSTVRNILVKKGSDVDANYTGAITEWIGGADNQAEFITEEVVSYDKRNSDGHYMQVYYLVSNMGGKWVIDDMKIISEEDKSGTELNDIIARLSK